MGGHLREDALTTADRGGTGLAVVEPMTSAIALRPAASARPAPMARLALRRVAVARPAVAAIPAEPVVEAPRSADHLRLPAPVEQAPDVRRASVRRVLAGATPAADGTDAALRVARMQRVLLALEVAQSRVARRALPEVAR